jgi:hypothetical protein
MDTPNIIPNSDAVQQRMRTAYAKFQSRLQEIRRERLGELKSIFRRLDDERLHAAKQALDQQ